MGLYDTVLNSKEYQELYSSQQQSMSGLGYQNSELSQTKTIECSEEDEPIIVHKRSKDNLDPLAIRKRPMPSKPKPLNVDGDKPLSAYGKPKSLQKQLYSNVRPGITLTHKAFGSGVVESVTSTKIFVSFNGVKKEFLFPDVIQQGFLKI